MKYATILVALLLAGCTQRDASHDRAAQSHGDPDESTTTTVPNSAFNSSDYYGAKIDAEPADEIKIGDTREFVERLIGKYRGIPSRIAYSRLENGNPVIAQPDLSVSFHRIEPILMVFLVDNTVTAIELGLPRQSEPKDDVKNGYTIESADNFSFFKHYSED